MRTLLLQLDGKLPNLALMRLASHHRDRGDEVTLRRTGQPDRTFDDLDCPPDVVYASAIFTKTQPVVERLMNAFPNAIVGGTGVNVSRRLEDFGVTTKRPDYSIYPKFRQSIGFTQRGCRLKCGFCVVPKKEGAISEEQSVWDLWRGEPWPRELVLLDNDFFGQPNWRQRVAEMREGGFKVNFNQGINARFMTDEAAEAIASIDYRDDGMTRRRIYTAWDNRKDEERLFAGLNRLVKYGVRPSHIMVYILIGYWPGETEEDWLHRARKLREFGADPYPMPYVLTPLTRGFQRWVIGSYDKVGQTNYVPWPEFKAAHCDPRKLGNRRQMSLPLFGAAESEVA